MREIKVKAWNKRTGTMSLPKTLKELVIMKDTLADLALMDGAIEWLEYTGLKDKNSKEIYEGDILQFRYSNRKELVVAEVKWCLSGWGLQGKYPSERYTTWWPSSYLHNGKGEAIGNIYENPELLAEP